jgi:hypothetical protein
MDCLQEGGTVFIWSSFENTALREIYEQMDQYGYDNRKLKSWLKTFVKFDKRDTCGYIDQAELCKKYYHHPEASGKYSIKYILPAVLAESRSAVITGWLQDAGLYQLDANGRIMNPYDLLPAVALPEGGRVQEGTAAIRAYQEMLYGVARNDPEQQRQWKEALLAYCKLDTLAMAIIWQYWKEKAGKKSGRFS